MKSNQHAEHETVAQRRARDADELVMAAKAGDPAAFDRLVRRFRPRIYALALHLSGSASDADDITQDAFVQAYRRLPQFEGRSQFFTWLYRIAVRRSIDAERERKRSGPFLEDTRVEVALRIDAHGDPGRTVELRQTYTALLGGLDALTPSLKSAVVLTALQGLSYQEAAVILGTTEGAIAVRIHEARKLLRAYLERAATPLKVSAAAFLKGLRRPPARREAPAAPDQDLALALAALL